jgi:hypothetical protein
MGVYCPNCGAVKPSMVGKPPPYAPSWMRTGWPGYQGQPRAQVRPVFKAIAAGIMISLTIWILLAFVTLIYGVGVVVPDIQDDFLGGFRLFVAVPYLIPFGSLSGTGLIVYYFLLVAAISASLAWVLFSSAKGFVKEITMKAKAREHTPLFEVCALMFATFFLNFVIILVTGAANDDTPGTGDTLSQLLLELANASVWEEIAVRVLFIGVPLIFIDLIRGKPRKDWYAYILGGKFKIGIPETGLVIFSASMFGVAHYLGGWGEWKIPAAGIVGIAFGYLYLKFGIAASITLHFTYDYLSMPGMVFNPDLDTVLTVLLLVWLGAGAIFTVYYSIRITEFLTGMRFWEETPRPEAYGQPYGAPPQAPYQQSRPYAQHPQPGPGYQPSYPPPPQVWDPSRGYVCPVCGNLEARWVNGRFQCLRCGHLS